MRYYVSLDFGPDSIVVFETNKKKEAITQAHYYRTGGLSYSNDLTTSTTSNIFDTRKETFVYSKPVFKKYVTK